MKIFIIAFLLFLVLFSLRVTALTLQELGFTKVQRMSGVPAEVRGPIIATVEAGTEEPKIHYFGERIGRVDSTTITYLGCVYPIISAECGFLSDSFYVILTTSKFRMIFGNASKDFNVETRLFLQILMDSGRSYRYLIK